MLTEFPLEFWIQRYAGLSDECKQLQAKMTSFFAYFNQMNEKLQPISAKFKEGDQLISNAREGISGVHGHLMTMFKWLNDVEAELEPMAAGGHCNSIADRWAEIETSLCGRQRWAYGGFLTALFLLIILESIFMVLVSVLLRFEDEIFEVRTISIDAGTITESGVIFG